MEVFVQVGGGGLVSLVSLGHSRDIFGLDRGGVSAAEIYRVEARDAAKHLGICRSTPATKLDWALNYRPTL